jgi:hypothetical protein
MQLSNDEILRVLSLASKHYRCILAVVPSNFPLDNFDNVHCVSYFSPPCGVKYLGKRPDALFIFHPVSDEVFNGGLLPAMDPHGHVLVELY